MKKTAQNKVQSSKLKVKSLFTLLALTSVLFNSTFLILNSQLTPPAYALTEDVILCIQAGGSQADCMGSFSEPEPTPEEPAPTPPEPVYIPQPTRRPYTPPAYEPIPEDPAYDEPASQPQVQQPSSWWDWFNSWWSPSTQPTQDDQTSAEQTTSDTAQEVAVYGPTTEEIQTAIEGSPDYQNCLENGGDSATCASNYVESIQDGSEGIETPLNQSALDRFLDSTFTGAANLWNGAADGLGNLFAPTGQFIEEQRQAEIEKNNKIAEAISAAKTYQQTLENEVSDSTITEQARKDMISALGLPEGASDQEVLAKLNQAVESSGFMVTGDLSNFEVQQRPDCLTLACAQALNTIISSPEQDAQAADFFADIITSGFYLPIKNLLANSSEMDQKLDEIGGQKIIDGIETEISQEPAAQTGDKYPYLATRVNEEIIRLQQISEEDYAQEVAQKCDGKPESCTEELLARKKYADIEGQYSKEGLRETYNLGAVYAMNMAAPFLIETGLGAISPVAKPVAQRAGSFLDDLMRPVNSFLDRIISNPTTKEAVEQGGEQVVQTAGRESVEEAANAARQAAQKEADQARPVEKPKVEAPAENPDELATNLPPEKPVTEPQPPKPVEDQPRPIQEPKPAEPAPQAPEPAPISEPPIEVNAPIDRTLADLEDRAPGPVKPAVETVADATRRIEDQVADIVDETESRIGRLLGKEEPAIPEPCIPGIGYRPSILDYFIKPTFAASKPCPITLTTRKTSSTQFGDQIGKGVEGFVYGDGETATKVAFNRPEIVKVQIEVLEKANGAGGLPKLKGVVKDKDTGEIVGYKMEQIKGERLDRYVGENGDINIERRIEFLKDLSDAHEATGIPSGDLANSSEGLASRASPANIMVEEGTGRLRIVDYGGRGGSFEAEITGVAEMLFEGKTYRYFRAAEATPESLRIAEIIKTEANKGKSLAEILPKIVEEFPQYKPLLEKSSPSVPAPVTNTPTQNPISRVFNRIIDAFSGPTPAVAEARSASSRISTTISAVKSNTQQGNITNSVEGAKAAWEQSGRALANAQASNDANAIQIAQRARTQAGQAIYDTTSLSAKATYNAAVVVENTKKTIPDLIQRANAAFDAGDTATGRALYQQVRAQVTLVNVTENIARETAEQSRLILTALPADVPVSLQTIAQEAAVNSNRNYRLLSASKDAVNSMYDPLLTRILDLPPSVRLSPAPQPGFFSRLLNTFSPTRDPATEHNLAFKEWNVIDQKLKTQIINGASKSDIDKTIAQREAATARVDQAYRRLSPAPTGPKPPEAPIAAVEKEAAESASELARNEAVVARQEAARARKEAEALGEKVRQAAEAGNTAEAEEATKAMQEAVERARAAQKKAAEASANAKKLAEAEVTDLETQLTSAQAELDGLSQQADEIFSKRAERIKRAYSNDPEIPPTSKLFDISPADQEILDKYERAVIKVRQIEEEIPIQAEISKIKAAVGNNDIDAAIAKAKEINDELEKKKSGWGQWLASFVPEKTPWIGSKGKEARQALKAIDDQKKLMDKTIKVLETEKVTPKVPKPPVPDEVPAEGPSATSTRDKPISPEAPETPAEAAASEVDKLKAERDELVNIRAAVKKTFEETDPGDAEAYRIAADNLRSAEKSLFEANNSYTQALRKAAQVEAEERALETIRNGARVFTRGGTANTIPPEQIENVLINEGFRGTPEEIQAAVGRLSDSVNAPLTVPPPAPVTRPAPPTTVTSPVTPPATTVTVPSNYSLPPTLQTNQPAQRLLEGLGDQGPKDLKDYLFIDEIRPSRAGDPSIPGGQAFTETSSPDGLRIDGHTIVVKPGATDFAVAHELGHPAFNILEDTALNNSVPKSPSGQIPKGISNWLADNPGKTEDDVVAEAHRILDNWNNNSTSGRSVFGYEGLSGPDGRKRGVPSVIEEDFATAFGILIKERNGTATLEETNQLRVLNRQQRVAIEEAANLLLPQPKPPTLTVPRPLSPVQPPTQSRAPMKVLIPLTALFWGGAFSGIYLGGNVISCLTFQVGVFCSPTTQQQPPEEKPQAEVLKEPAAPAPGGLDVEQDGKQIGSEEITADEQPPAAQPSQPQQPPQPAAPQPQPQVPKPGLTTSSGLVMILEDFVGNLGATIGFPPPSPEKQFEPVLTRNPKAKETYRGPGCWGSHAVIMKTFEDGYVEYIQDFGEIPGQCSVPAPQCQNNQNNIRTYTQCGNTVGLEGKNPVLAYRITSTFDCNSNKMVYKTQELKANDVASAICEASPSLPNTRIPGAACEVNSQCMNGFVCDAIYTQKCVSSIEYFQTKGKKAVERCQELKTQDLKCYKNADKSYTGKYKYHDIKITPTAYEDKQTSSEACNYAIIDFGFIKESCPKGVTP